MSSSAGKRKTRSSQKAAAPLEVDGDTYIKEIWEFSLDPDCYDENGDLKVFETCEELRKSIKNFLKNTAYRGVTKEKMLKLLDIEDEDYDEFFRFGGIAIGVQCKTYTAFYEFLEKMRIKENEPKSKRRKQLEQPGEKGFYYSWKNLTEIVEESDGEGGIKKKRKVKPNGVKFQ